MSTLERQVAEFISTDYVYVIWPSGRIDQVTSRTYRELPRHARDQVHVRFTYRGALGVAATLQRRKWGQS